MLAVLFLEDGSFGGAVDVAFAALSDGDDQMSPLSPTACVKRRGVVGSVLPVVCPRM